MGVGRQIADELVVGKGDAGTRCLSQPHPGARATLADAEGGRAMKRTCGYL